jgi:hypothetical protein
VIAPLHGIGLQPGRQTIFLRERQRRLLHEPMVEQEGLELVRRQAVPSKRKFSFHRIGLGISTKIIATNSRLGEITASYLEVIL